MKFNINDSVRVKLNDYGRSVIRQNHLALFPQLTKVEDVYMHLEDADGYSKWQLWDLMHTFGSVLGLGREVPFDTEIELIVPSP